MLVIVLGAGGFIGKATCTALEAAGYEVRRVTSEPVITNWLNKADAVINLAWRGLPDYSPGKCNDNFAITKSYYAWLQSFLRIGRFVGVGTQFETHPVPGSEWFVKTKENIKELGKRSFPGRFTWARPAYVYGHGQRSSSLFPQVYKALQECREPSLNDPDAEHDFIHVDDVARGLVRLCDPSIPVGEYELCTGVKTKVRDAAALMASMVSKRPQTPPGWKPMHTLESGLHQTLQEWGAL